MQNNTYKMYWLFTIANIFFTTYAMVSTENPISSSLTSLAGRAVLANTYSMDPDNKTNVNPHASIDTPVDNAPKQNLTSIDEVFETLPGVDSNDPEEIARKEYYRNNLDVFDNILDINKHVGKENELYEGDIRRSVFRNAGGGRPWPKIQSGPKAGLVEVPYIISSDYDSAQKQIIRSALNTFRKYTCIRFIPKKNERSYIKIQDSQGCWAYVGQIGIPGQTVSLGVPGCVSKGIAMHELMHTLGFQHEQSRNDRDRYIKVIGQNIAGGWNPNFDKLSYTRNLVVYDYGSVLHYGKTSFSKYPYLPTIEVNPKRNPSPSFGQRSRLSPYDIEEMKYLYNCGPGTYPRCGRDFRGLQRGSFNSPAYPKNYADDSHCTWNITVRNGQYVEIEFTNVDIEDSPLCQKDAILVHDGVNAAAPVLQKICGNHATVTVRSSSRSMFVIFSSDPNGVATGFRATFRQVASPGKRPPLFLPQPTLPPITRTIQRLSCTFDNGLCGLIQDQDDNLDFTVNSGSTPTHGTGPRSDHTSRRGNYIYIESSQPAVVGDNAILRTPWFSARRLCVTFSYHMNGAFMGSLRLSALIKANNRKHGTSQILLEKHGDQGDKWHTVQVDFSPTANVQNVQFFFEGFVYYYLSDMAIDDVRIDPGRCPKVPRKVVPSKSPTTASTTTASTTTVSIKRVSTTTEEPNQSTTAPPPSSNNKGFQCDFESGICGMIQQQDDEFDWTRQQGSTSSSRTGPTIDHSEKTALGYYMYIEGSNPRVTDDVARLATPTLKPRRYCVSFAYHMYGVSIGSIQVSSLTRPSGIRVVEWQESGDQGDQWHIASFEYQPSSLNANSVQFIFDGRIGSGFRSDAAIDDIDIRPGACADSSIGATTRKPKVTTPKPTTTKRTTTTTTTATTTTTPSTTTTVRPAPSSRSYVAIGMPMCTFESKQRVRTNQEVPLSSIPGRSTNDLGKYTYPTNIFSDNSCGLKQASGFDNFDWTSHSGRTSTDGTGPSGDKTTGQGTYMYAEASSKSAGDVAVMQSYTMPAGEYCFRFFYHMYGNGMGSLKIRAVQQLQNRRRSFPVIKEFRGGKGNQWRRSEIDFSPNDNAVNVRFNIEAVVGRTSRSDIAIDNLAILPGKCAACLNPTHQFGRNPTTAKKFSTGCINSDLFYVRCCSKSSVKFIIRRVQQCNKRMFPPVRLNWYCENL